MSVPQVNRIITPKFSTCTILAYGMIPVLWQVFEYLVQNYYAPLLNDEILFYLRHGWFSAVLCVYKRQTILFLIRSYGNGLVFALTTLVSYALLLLGTVVFVMVFKWSILKRKSLTTRKRKGDSAKETRLMLSVFVICVIFIITGGPRTIYRMADYFFIPLKKSTGITYFILADVFALLQAVNHTFNIFVYLGMNTQFRKTFCNIFMLKRISKAKWKK